eukprot:5353727-Prymnesium_polylepis.1
MAQRRNEPWQLARIVWAERDSFCKAKKDGRDEEARNRGRSHAPTMLRKLLEEVERAGDDGGLHAAGGEFRELCVDAQDAVVHVEADAQPTAQGFEPRDRLGCIIRRLCQVLEVVRGARHSRCCC